MTHHCGRGSQRGCGHVNMHESCVFMCLKFLVILRLTSTYVYGWNSEDLELFDLVEEVNENFYDVLGISQVSFERSYNREETPLSIHTAGRLYSHLPNIDL